MSSGRMAFEVVSYNAVSNTPGTAGSPGKPGLQGKGGCGETVEKCTAMGDGAGANTQCKSKSNCADQYRGKSCQKNQYGLLGSDGQTTDELFVADITKELSIHHQIQASPVFQDFLLKYAVSLMNSQTIDESQEVLTFLSRFSSPSGDAADSLLSIMTKEGRIQTDRKVVPKESFHVIKNRISERIIRGKIIEKSLKTLGKHFNYKSMANELFEVMLDIVQSELRLTNYNYDIEKNSVATHFDSLEKMETHLAFIQFDVTEDLEKLVSLINQQIQSLEMAADRQKRFGVLGSIMSCVTLFIPGVGKPIREKVC